MKRKKTKYEISELPLYCDFTCQFAEFAPPESVGACRKDIAVYCGEDIYATYQLFKIWDEFLNI